MQSQERENQALRDENNKQGEFVSSLEYQLERAVSDGQDLARETEVRVMTDMKKRIKKLNDQHAEEARKADLKFRQQCEATKKAEADIETWKYMLEKEQQSFEGKVQAMKDELDAQKEVIASKDKTIKSLEAKNAKVQKDRERLNLLYENTKSQVEDAKKQVM